MITITTITTITPITTITTITTIMTVTTWLQVSLISALLQAESSTQSALLVLRAKMVMLRC